MLRRANELSFGRYQLPTFDLARTRYLLNFGTDFLGTWNSPLAHSVAYGRMRAWGEQLAARARRFAELRLPFLRDLARQTALQETATGLGGLAVAAVGAWLAVMLGAAATACELALSGTIPLHVVLPAMLGTHALIGAGEAVITVAAVSAVLSTRPDLIARRALVTA